MSVPLKLGLTYEACFNDPYSSLSRLPRSAAALATVPRGKVAAAPGGWLSSILSTITKKNEKASPQQQQQPRGPLSVTVRSTAVVAGTMPPPTVELHAAAEEVTSSLPIEGRKIKEVDLPSSPSASPALKHATGIVEQHVEGTSSNGAATLMAHEEQEAIKEEEVMHAPSPVVLEITVVDGAKTTLDAQVCTRADAEAVAVAERKTRVAAELAGVAEPLLANDIQKLYDSIELCGIKAVALDDLNHQLAEQVGTSSPQVQPLRLASSVRVADNDVNHSLDTLRNQLLALLQAAPAPHAQQPSAIEKEELAHALYGLRAQVQGLLRVVAAQESKATAEGRTRSKKDAASRKECKVKVEVVRLYEEDPQPRVKGPYRPVAIPSPQAQGDQSKSGDKKQSHREKKGNMKVKNKKKAHPRAARRDTDYDDDWDSHPSTIDTLTETSIDSSVAIYSELSSGASSSGSFTGHSSTTSSMTDSASTSDVSRATASSAAAVNTGKMITRKDDGTRPSTNSNSSLSEASARDAKVRQQHTNAAASRRSSSKRESDSSLVSNSRRGDASETKKGKSSGSSNSSIADFFWQRRMDAMKRKVEREKREAAEAEAAKAQRGTRRAAALSSSSSELSSSSLSSSYDSKRRSSIRSTSSSSYSSRSTTTRGSSRSSNSRGRSS